MSSYEARAHSLKGLTRRAPPSKKRTRGGGQEAHDDQDDDPFDEIEQEANDPPTSSQAFNLHNNPTGYPMVGGDSSHGVSARTSRPPYPSSLGGLDPGLSLKSFIKAPTLAQSRKWARGEELQAQAARQALMMPPPPVPRDRSQQGAGASSGRGGGGGRGEGLETIHPELQEAMKSREEADRYIASFLSKVRANTRHLTLLT